MRLFPDRTQGFFVPVRVRDGRLTAAVAVTRTVRIQYSPQTGLLLTEATSNYNSAGKLEHVVRAAYYVWQVAEYAVFRERHIWSPVVASVKFWREDGQPAPGEPRAISLTTYKQWYASIDATLTFWARARSLAASSAAAYDPRPWCVPVRRLEQRSTAALNALDCQRRSHHPRHRWQCHDRHRSTRQTDGYAAQSRRDRPRG